MTPMIDVVFLLIIFFLVSSHLAQQETHLPLDLPTASTSLVNDLEIAPLTIHVDAESQWQVASRRLDLSGIRRALADYQRDAAEPAIRIRSDRHVPYESIEPLLREAAAAGISDVRIAVIAD